AWSVGRLSLLPGLRVSTQLVETSALWPPSGAPATGSTELFVSPDPRLGLRFQLGEGVGLVGALGTYTQAPEPADLSAVFGHPKLRPSRAVHATLGFSVEFSAFVGLELLGYEKELIDLAVRGVSAS